MSEGETLEELLEVLRRADWTVALHTDMRDNGGLRTSWTFAHPRGRWIRGEGRTDRDAVAQVLRLVREECR